MDAPSAKRRWYLPTPAWLVYGAAIATGVLFACERWRWFPVHYQKGWPVLLAVAVVWAVLVLLPAWMLVAMVFRRRVQFGLRTMLVFVTLCAVVCSWLAVRIKQARRQAEVIAAIEKYAEVDATYHWEGDYHDWRFGDVRPPAPEPLGKLLGFNFFADITSLRLLGRFTDERLADVAVLTRVKSLELVSDNVTDAGLSHLAGLRNLRELRLVNTKVTEEGVKKLKQLFPTCKIWVSHVSWDEF
jgi:hypothetical protein